jgi:AraC-like DNA-binding protein
MTFVFISRDSCPEFAAIFDAASNLKISGALSALLADFLLILESRLPFLEAHQLPVLGRSALSMIATCLAPTRDTLAYARPEIAATLLERAKRYIRSNIGSHTLSAEELCLALGVSRTQLYRLFEGHGGVAREIRLQRLIASHAVLVDPNDRRPVYRISEDFGFTSADEFGRAFRRQFGYTPGDARYLRRRQEAVAYGLPPEGDDFRGWMRDLGRPRGK